MSRCAAPVSWVSLPRGIVAKRVRLCETWAEQKPVAVVVVAAAAAAAALD